MGEFNFNAEQEETRWLVDKLIPLGHLCFVLAQAGVGKSLLLNSLATAIIHNRQYAGLDTMGGDVLIIDQDTPQNVLTKRLLRWNASMGTTPKHKLYVESMRGYSLSDGTLMSVMKEHPSCVLVIVDCLHSVCGKLNSNYTTDMNVLAKLKNGCLDERRTILFNHHISQKAELSTAELMTGTTSHLAMGNSAIIQQADSYYILGAAASEGRTNRLYVRPVSKRVSIPTNPIILRLIETDSGEEIYYEGYYEVGLGQVENHVLLLFRELNIERTVKEVYDAMGHRHGEQAIRQALNVLDDKGLLVMSRNRNNLFKYRLAGGDSNVARRDSN